MISKQELREKRRWLREQNQKYQPGIFVEIPRSDWPQRPQSMPLTKVMRSREFLVQVFGGGEVTRLTVNRTELNDAGHWKDGITWDEMQAVKDGCGFADCDAVEAHPRKQDITYIANMRHLWIVPTAYAQFFWRRGEGSGFKSGKTASELIGLNCAPDCSGNADLRQDAGSAASKPKETTNEK